MEKDAVKVLLATVTAITIFNIVTHGTQTATIATGFLKGWSNILAVLSGQRRASGF